MSLHRDVIFEEVVHPLAGASASATGAVTTSAVTFGETGDRVVFDIFWGDLAGAQTVKVELSQDGTNYAAIKGDDGNDLELDVPTTSANLMSQIQLNAFNAKKARLVIPRDNEGAIVSVTARTYNGRMVPSPNTNAPDLRVVIAYAPNRLPNGWTVRASA